MGRRPCCDGVGLKKGPWTEEEDQKLASFLLGNDQCCWRAVPRLAGLLRCGKSCRLRWTNYLRPDLKRGPLSDEEERTVIQLHRQLGNRWSKIASRLPGRTDNEIKNHWNTHITKKLRKMGIDPVTHKPLQAFGEHLTSPEQHNVPVAEEKAAVAAARGSQAYAHEDMFGPDEVAAMMQLLQDIIIPRDVVSASSPAESSLSSSSSSPSACLVDELPVYMMGLEDMVTMPASAWEFEGNFNTYQRIALSDLEEAWT